MSRRARSSRSRVAKYWRPEAPAVKVEEREPRPHRGIGTAAEPLDEMSARVLTGLLDMSGSATTGALAWHLGFVPGRRYPDGYAETLTALRTQGLLRFEFDRAIDREVTWSLTVAGRRRAEDAR